MEKKSVKLREQVLIGGKWYTILARGKWTLVIAIPKGVRELYKTFVKEYRTVIEENKGGKKRRKICANKS